jgi:hypothetical protein
VVTAELLESANDDPDFAAALQTWIGTATQRRESTNSVTGTVSGTVIQLGSGSTVKNIKL